MECPSKHEDSSELLISYVEGSLEPGAYFAFERHLQVCERCREITEAQRELWAALDSWAPAAISADFDERLYRRIASQESSKISWWTWRPAMPVAAACAALIAVFLLHGPSTEPVGSSSIVQVRGPQIEQVESALEDIEMLKQLGLHSASETAPREKI
jgi:anti-sigma factor RsiW